MVVWRPTRPRGAGRPRATHRPGSRRTATSLYHRVGGPGRSGGTLWEELTGSGGMLWEDLKGQEGRCGRTLFSYVYLVFLCMLFCYKIN